MNGRQATGRTSNEQAAANRAGVVGRHSHDLNCSRSGYLSCAQAAEGLGHPKAAALRERLEKLRQKREATEAEGLPAVKST